METKIFVRKEDALKKIFKGVKLDSLAVGEKSMVTKMNYVEGNFATLHTHPHEQCGYVISGEYRLIVEAPNGKIDVIMQPGRHICHTRQYSPFFSSIKGWRGD